MLKLYPDRVAAGKLEKGFTEGFRLNYTGPRKQYICRNLPSVNKNPHIAKQKVLIELKAGRVAGPYKKPPLPTFRCSPLGLVEKSQKGKFRLIHHLSFPEGESVNDYISDQEATVTYTTFDQAVEQVAKLGKGALIAKADLKDAFRLLPINCDDFNLLGFTLGGDFFFDMALPMGLKISCRYFELFSTFLDWLINSIMGRRLCVHYLDDWLFFSPMASQAESSLCMQVLKRFFAMCKLLGIPVAEEKTVLPCTCLTFLGLEIDTNAQQVKVPQCKLDACGQKLKAVQNKSSISLRELQSLLGYLNFLTRAVSGGRTFLQRLVHLTRGVLDKTVAIEIGSEAQADISMWLCFLKEFNGVTMFLPSEWLQSSVIHLYTDAAKTLGFGAFFKGRWFNGTWQEVNVSANNSIAYLEYVPVLLAMLVWGLELSNTKIMLHSDNQAVVAIMNRQSSKCPHIMRLVRRLTLTCLRHNIVLRGEYIQGCSNTIADKLSRFEMTNFFQEVPTANLAPTQYKQFLPLTLKEN